MIVDTSALLAFFDTDEPDHVRSRRSSTTPTSPSSSHPTWSPSSTTSSRLGWASRPSWRFCAELTGGAWDLPAIDVEELVELARSSSATPTSGSASRTPRTSSSPRATGRRRSSPSITGTSTSSGRSAAVASRSCRSAERDGDLVPGQSARRGASGRLTTTGNGPVRPTRFRHLGRSHGGRVPCRHGQPIPRRPGIHRRRSTRPCRHAQPAGRPRRLDGLGGPRRGRGGDRYPG